MLYTKVQYLLPECVVCDEAPYIQVVESTFDYLLQRIIQIVLGWVLELLPIIQINVKSNWHLPAQSQIYFRLRLTPLRLGWVSRYECQGYDSASKHEHLHCRFGREIKDAFHCNYCHLATEWILYQAAVSRSPSAIV